MGVVIAVAHAGRQDRGGARDQDTRGAEEMASARGLHDLTFQLAPAVAGREDCDSQPLRDRGQLLRLTPVAPQGSTLREAEFRPAAPRFPLFRRQPLAQGGHEEIMSELIMRLAAPDRAAIDRRHELQLGVQDPHELSEFIHPIGVAGRREQFAARVHASFYVDPTRRQQAIEDLAGGTLMNLAVRRAPSPKALSRNLTPSPREPPTAWSVTGVHSCPLTISAKTLRCTGITWPFCDSSVTDCRHKGLLVFHRGPRGRRQCTKGSPERGEDDFRVVNVE